MELREYQKAIVEDVFKHEDNVLVVLPTGGGKTVIARSIISRLKERVLFIVPKLELIRQAAKIFDEPVDIIWSSQTSIKGNHITIASKQTLLNRNLSKYFDCPVAVIVDEVHIGLQTLKSVISGANVSRIIGLTATPERNDGSSFLLKDYVKEKFDSDKIYRYAVFHRVINQWNIQELQKMGYLSPLKVIINPEAEKLREIKTKHRYDDELDSDQIMGAMGDDFFKFVKKAKEFKGKPTLIFTPDISSADVVMSTLNKSGLRYDKVDGTMSVEERSVILRNLDLGMIDGIVNCAVLTTGFDMPKVKQCILIRNIRSRSLFFQVVGRFIRPYNNEVAMIYDFGGSSYNFATASVPDVFASPVEWRYEGFEVKDIDEAEAKITDDLKECLEETNITWTEYLKDPVKTLLDTLLRYKENFEVNLCNISLAMKNNFAEIVDKEVKRKSDKIRNEIETKVMEDNEELIQKEVERRVTEISVNPIKEWFSMNGFDWFRGNFHRILSENNYCESQEYVAMKFEIHSCNDDESCAEFEKKHHLLLDKLNKIKVDTIMKLPFEGFLQKLKDDKALSDEFDRYYDERTDWWLTNFKPRTEFNGNQHSAKLG